MSHKAPTHFDSTIASSSATTEEAEKASWVSMAMATPSRSAMGIAPWSTLAAASICVRRAPGSSANGPP